LTYRNLGDAGLAAVTGTLVARVVMGTVCDVVGPRYG
jgi:NNP family nitrate/nitrite transporter-like MFS transporter